jgi:hypothetical protein
MNLILLVDESVRVVIKTEWLDRVRDGEPCFGPAMIYLRIQLQDPAFYLNVDPDPKSTVRVDPSPGPAYYLNADLDPKSHMKTDPCADSGLKTLIVRKPNLQSTVRADPCRGPAAPC